MSFNPQLGRLRSANCVESYPAKQDSEDGQRRILGRNVKRQTGQRGVYDVVRSFTCKIKTDNQWVTVRAGVSEPIALAFLQG